MLCLRIHRGLPVRQHDETWARKKAAQAAQFFATDLAAHFKAEEEALFPAMGDFSGASVLLSELLTEHRTLEVLAERLRGTEVAKLVGALGEFADLLEAHIRKEERELFPLYEKHMSPAMAAEVGREVKNIIGNAMQPRNPVLLR